MRSRLLAVRGGGAERVPEQVRDWDAGQVSERGGTGVRSRLLAAEIVAIHASSYFERVKPKGQNRLT